MQILIELPSRGASEFVFPGNRADKPLSAPGYAWKRIRDRAGLPGLHIHDLRHSFASFLINDGAPLEVVSSALGHSSLAMTQRYAHLKSETVRSAMEKTAALRIGYVPSATLDSQRQQAIAAEVTDEVAQESPTVRYEAPGEIGTLGSAASTADAAGEGPA